MKNNFKLAIVVMSTSINLNFGYEIISRGKIPKLN